MKTRSIWMWLLATLLLTACSVDDDTAQYDLNDSNKTAEEDMAFEGVWSIDDEPIAQTYTVVWAYQNGHPAVVLPTFPYEAVLKHLLPELGNSQVKTPDVPAIISIAPVGFTSNSSYYEVMRPDIQQGYAYDSSLMFEAIIADGAVKVTLGLLVDKSVFSNSLTSANCILFIKTVKTVDADGQQRTLALNPERVMTFVSTKRK